MSQHSITYIDQKKLHHLGNNRHFSINAELVNNGTKFNVNFYDKINDFDPAAKIYVQSYVKGGQSIENFYYGQISKIKKPENTFIENFKPTEILFRIRISHNDLIIARVDSIAPTMSDGNEEKSSIIGVRETEMDEIFKIENEPGEKPVIVFKKGTNLLNEFRNDHIIKGLILTSAVRSILSDYLKILDFTAQEKSTMFLDYFAEISGEKYPQLTDEEKQRQEFASTDEWIDEAMIAFNKKPVINSNSLMDMFEKAMIQKEEKEES